MTDLIEVKTADLAGEALGWAVGAAEGLDLILVPPEYGNPWRVFARHQGQATEHTKRYNPWEDWALGGKLIESHGVSSEPCTTGWFAERYGDGQQRTYEAEGSTTLVAVCRTIVSAKLGSTANVPKELMP